MHQDMGIELLQAIPLENTKIKSDFWSSYMDLVIEKVIPYQWEALNDRIKDIEPPAPLGT